MKVTYKLFIKYIIMNNLHNDNKVIPLKIGILGSTKGTSLQPIINAIESNNLQAEIVIVISNKKESGILERALTHSIPTQHISPYKPDGKKKTTTEFDEEVSQILTFRGVELILMIGYMRIVSKEFCQTWKNRCLNVHPSLLPEFAKGMDLDVHTSVIQSGKTTSGCTIHFVTEELDGGPILCQKECPVYTDDTPEILKQRVQSLEGEAFIYAINKIGML